MPPEAPTAPVSDPDTLTIVRGAVVALNAVPEIKTTELGYDPRSCVSYVRSRRPDLDMVWITPKHFYETHGMLKDPFVGAVGISAEGPAWHAWLIEEIEGDHILISETNFLGDFKSTRSLPLDSALIMGYR